MSWIEDQAAAVIRRQREAQAWAEAYDSPDARHAGSGQGAHHQLFLPHPAPPPGSCSCASCEANRGTRSSGRPDSDDWTDYGGQPGSVVLARMQADEKRRNARLEARLEAAARYAEPEIRGDGLLGQLARRNPDGSNISGSALKDWLDKHKPVNRWVP